MRGVVGHNYAPTERQLTVSSHTAGDGQDEPPQGAAQYRAAPGGGERGSRRRPGATGTDGDGTAPPTTPPRPAPTPLAAGRAGRERESDPRAAASATVPGDRRAAPQPSRHGASTRTRT
ncbi:hypothetical protein [Streptomyces niveus]|uniref:hypothetical protein n=1 Tax=Streptomyces niveus TaxID=193462 RepID=UPI0036666BF4